MTAWRPLLEGGEADRALEAIAALLADLEEAGPTEPGLFFGQAGLALLHGQQARCGDADAADRAAAALEHAAAALAEERAPWLASGFAGVAFAIAHLTDVVDTDPDALPDLDDVIAHVVAREEWPFDWELMDGLIGLGVYGLERGAAPGGRAIAGHAVAHLAALASRDAEGTSWRVREGDLPDELLAQNPEGYHNLGVAHGTAGAVGFLAAAAAAEVPGAADLLRGAAGWLRAQDRPGAPIRFAMLRAAGYLDPAERADGWCYGDPGTAAVLLAAGRSADEAGWVDHGIAIARHAARTAPPAADLTLCHGAGGRGHIYNRIAQAAGCDELADAARRELGRVLDARRPGAGLGGFDRIAGVSGRPPVEPGLLLGAAGLALALLAAVTDREPSWDRALLLSRPPPA